MGDENPIRTLGDYSKPSHDGYSNTIELPKGNNVDVPSTSDRHLVELENQVQCLMEAYLALTQSNQVQKSLPHVKSVTVLMTLRISWKTPNKPSLNTHLCVPMKREDARLSKFEADFKQQQSEMTNKIDTMLKAITDRIAGIMPSDTVKNPKLGTHSVSSARSYLTMDSQCSTQIHDSINTITIQPKQTEKPQADEPKIEHQEGNFDNTNPNPLLDQLASISTEQVRKFNSMLESLGLVPRSSNTKFVCSKEDDGELMYIEIIRENDELLNEVEEAPTKEPTIEYFDTLPTREELTYHRYLMSGPVP
ncbi:hypothetical protein Tco_0939930 [Tanacetum coccineum]|uniref:Uncharacterized protein n=1 Tax=Tanacetum coccineum TaxID=301880 RepID=A0ABQ5DLK0_9ASTR